ncbi:MAG: hypothetical protein WAT19_13330 [Ferruginibacter sp.]
MEKLPLILKLLAILLVLALLTLLIAYMMTPMFRGLSVRKECSHKQCEC